MRPDPVHRSTTGASAARVIAVIGLARPSPVALTSASLRVQVRKNAVGSRPSRSRSTGSGRARRARRGPRRRAPARRPGRPDRPGGPPRPRDRRHGSARTPDRPEAPACRAVPRSGRCGRRRVSPGAAADQRCEDEPRERVRGEVARLVGGPAEAGEAVALVVVEQADQRRCGLRGERGRPPDRAALRGWHGRDATQDRRGQARWAPPGRAGRPPPRAPAARLRISPSGGRD